MSFEWGSKNRKEEKRMAMKFSIPASKCASCRPMIKHSREELLMLLLLPLLICQGFFLS